MLSTAALAAAAGLAHAEQAPLILAANEFTAPAVALGSNVEAPHGTLEWDSRKGRWGLRLGVQQHTDRGPDWRDYQPGLYYKITPRLHIGGAVSLAPDQIDTSRPGEPQAPPPRVRLETTFKF
jgi:hypothetical protein